MKRGWQFFGFYRSKKHLRGPKKPVLNFTGPKKHVINFKGSKKPVSITFKLKGQKRPNKHFSPTIGVP